VAEPLLVGLVGIAFCKAATIAAEVGVAASTRENLGEIGLATCSGLRG